MHVVAVVASDDPFVHWNVDAEIVDAVGVGGLIAGGQTPVGFEVIASTTLLVEYPAAVNAGQPWHVNAAACAITFDGGAVLLDQDGTTEAP